MNNTDTPPPISFQADAPVLTGAGFGIRALARIIDWCVVLGVALVAGVLSGITLAILQRTGHVEAGWIEKIQVFNFGAFMLGLLGGIGYHAICEGLHGATLGKLICGLRVMRVDGSRSNMTGAIIRSFAWLLDGLFFGLIGYSVMKRSPLQQRNGDVWGKTVVLRTGHIAPENLRSTGRFLAACATGLLFYGIMETAGLFLHLV
jgi:uncharacterized RDD family membrane protein YckC